MTDRLHVHQGDITTLAVDAIVNAANEALASGGGVCGAIFRAAGPGLEEECRAVGPCPTGEARITGGYGLPALHIIHAVGPVWRGGGAGEPDLLAACYRNSLKLAADNALATIAFPAISQGIFGFPAEQATDIAVRTVAGMLTDHPCIEQVIFCCFSADSAELHRAAITGLQD